MKNCDEKITELISIIKNTIKVQDCNLEIFQNDEIYEKVLNKYKVLLEVLETKDIKKIFSFLEELINYLSNIINKCKCNNIKTTLEVVKDRNIDYKQDVYELNEYYIIVLYLYDLFLEKSFNRSDYLKYQFSKSNLEKIKEDCKNRL